LLTRLTLYLYRHKPTMLRIVTLLTSRNATCKLDAVSQANAILGLEPGEVFVQRNVGNQATHTDLNCMSCLEYSVKELKVRRGFAAVSAAREPGGRRLGTVTLRGCGVRAGLGPLYGTW
jgi:hypothetical protein